VTVRERLRRDEEAPRGGRRLVLKPLG
jgi:hypothetical protein